MDPYLEHPDLFPGLHDRFITYISEILQPKLPSPYIADIGRRAWIELSNRSVQPDVHVARSNRDRKSSRKSEAGVAVAQRRATQSVVIHVPHDEHREPFIEIYIGRGKDRRLVTHLEVLSPSNKTPDAQGVSCTCESSKRFSMLRSTWWRSIYCAAVRTRRPCRWIGSAR